MRGGAVAATVATAILAAGCGDNTVVHDRTVVTVVKPAPAPTTSGPSTAPPPSGGAVPTATYKIEFTAAGEQFQRDAQSAAVEVTSSPTAEGKVAGLKSLRTAVITAADRFDSLTPPANATVDHRALVAELNRLGDDVLAIQAAVRTKDQARAQKLVPKLQEEQSKIQTTLAALKREVR